VFKTLKTFLGRTRDTATATKLNRAKLGMQQLEDRLTPIIGAAAMLANGTFPLPAADTAWTGVVRVDAPNGWGSGTLLSTGRHILTAAHVIDRDVDANGDGRNDRGDGQVDSGTFSVSFTLPSGVTRTIRDIPAANVRIPTGWNGVSSAGSDLAVIELPALAAMTAERHDLYRGSDEASQTMTLVGYGVAGNGAVGTSSASPAGTRRAGQNRFDLTSGDGKELLHDFDNGLRANDANGNNNGVRNLGLGTAEATSGSGDSGGGQFIGRRVAGVTRSSGGGTASDTNTAVNDTFGEVGWGTRVSVNASWIDTQTAGRYQLVLDLTAQATGNDGFVDVTRVQRNGTYVELFVNDARAHRELAANLTGVTILGSDDVDSVLANQDLGVPLTVDGRGGTDRLVINHTSAANGGADGVTVDSNAVAINSWLAYYSGLEDLTVNTGGGADNVFVGSTRTGTVTTVKTEGAADRITVGARLDGTNWTMDAIDGRLVIDGGTEADTLTFNDSGDATANTYALTAGRLTRTGAANVEWSAAETLSLLAGRGADTITASSAPAGSVIDGGAGYDRVTVGGGNLARVNGLTVRAGANGGELTLDDTAAPKYGSEGNTYFVRNGEVQRQKPVFAAGSTVPTQWSLDAEVDHSDFNTVAVKAGTGNDLIRLGTTSSGPITTIFAGAGHDIVIGGAADDTVYGEGGNDILVGGSGADTLRGGEGEDIVIGGSLTDTTTTRLRNLRTDWIAPTPFWTRVTAMRAGLTAGVIDDTATDSLYGEGGLDWFWGVWVGSPMEVKDFQIVGSTVEAVR